MTKPLVPQQYSSRNGLVGLISVLPGKFRPEHSTEHVDELKGDSRQRAISVDYGEPHALQTTAPAGSTSLDAWARFSAGNTTKDNVGATHAD